MDKADKVEMVEMAAMVETVEIKADAALIIWDTFTVAKVGVVTAGMAAKVMMVVMPVVAQGKST